MLRNTSAWTNKGYGSRRLLFALVALAAAAALAGVLTSSARAVPVGEEVHLEGSCGLLDAWNEDCEHITPTFEVIVPRPKRSGSRRSPVQGQLYVLTRPATASCLVYRVYVGYPPDAGDIWNNALIMHDVSHAIPLKSHKNSRQWDVDLLGRYRVLLLQVRVRFYSFLNENNWIVPDCKERGVFPTGGTVTNDTQLRYHAVVRLTAIKEKANWKSRRWENWAPPSEPIPK